MSRTVHPVQSVGRCIDGPRWPCRAIGDLRRLPATLDLTYLAAGRLDAAVLVDTKPWDVAAGLLIAVEAGAHYGSRAPDQLVLAATRDLAAAIVTML